MCAQYGRVHVGVYVGVHVQNDLIRGAKCVISLDRAEKRALAGELQADVHSASLFSRDSRESGIAHR